MPENEKINIEQKVMNEITSGKVKLRSRYIFLAEKLGLGSAFALSVLLAVLFFNLFLFYLKASDNLVYLSFGSRGWFAFLESFPYLMVVVLVILLLLASFIMKKANWSHKRPFGFYAAILIGLIVILGAVLTFTKLAERFEAGSFGRRGPGMMFRPFFQPGLTERNSGVVGRIIEIGADYLSIQTPHGVKNVDLSKLEMPAPAELQTGMFIMAIGERREEVFEAHLLRIVEDEGLPMIQRGVHRRFDLPDSEIF